VLILALGIGATTSIFSLVDAILLKSLPVTNPGELYRLGNEARCCYWGGYSQEKEFSLVSYDLYKHFRDNTTGFAELAAFSAAEPLFGDRRAETAEPARSYPGEYVSGNYFTMFGVRAYASAPCKRDFTARCIAGGVTTTSERWFALEEGQSVKKGEQQQHAFSSSTVIPSTPAAPLFITRRSAACMFPRSTTASAVRLTIHPVGLVEDFHLLVRAPCRAHKPERRPVNGRLSHARCIVEPKN
jgi:hypothetical protein